MKKVVFAVITASMFSSAIAEPLIGNNIKGFIGLPSTDQLVYDSSFAFEVNGEVFVSDAVYLTGAWGAMAFGQQDNSGNTATIAQGHFMVGLGYEQIIQPEVAVFGEAAFGSLAGTAEYNGEEVASADGSVNKFGIGLRANTPKYYSEIMLARNSGTWDGSEPDVNISLESDIGLNVSDSVTLGLRSALDFDFENSVIGITAGFRF